MGFHEVRFPETLSFGSVGGPERRTEIVALTNGYEERNAPWAHSRRRYDAGLGLRSLDDVEALIAFFEARQGQLIGFRWKDWGDYKSSLPSAEVTSFDQIIGAGDDATLTFQLRKTYASGGVEYYRPIAKLVAGTVRMGLSGDALQEGTEYAVNTATGVVTLAFPPPLGSIVTAGFEFDTPVRFDIDRIQTSVSSFKAGQVPTVPIIEVRI